jgi:hypothetical protein
MGSMLGNANEQPVHQVTLTYPFWMGKHEVTQGQFQALLGSNPSQFAGTPNAALRPVERVSWYAARQFCQALTAAEQAAGRVPTGYEYRLPTEAEWEYCCRAGTTTEWSTGASISMSQANINGALASPTWPTGQTAVVGSYPANAFGVHDLHGNVAEWCLDSFVAYTAAALVDPFFAGGWMPPIRGGTLPLGDPRLVRQRPRGARSRLPLRAGADPHTLTAGGGAAVRCVARARALRAARTGRSGNRS